MKMKNIFLLFFGIIFFGCSIDNCVKSVGEISSETIILEPFDKIYIFKGISATIHQSESHKMIIQTGKNIRPHISYTLIDGILSIRDDLDCNWVRQYGVTHVDIFSPNLKEIHSRTEKNISSNGVLTYPSLGLYAIDLEEGAGLGDFYIQINNQFVDIGANNVAAYYLSGSTQQLNLGIYNGTGRYHLENLQVYQNTTVFHRGMNDAFIYPLGELSGNLYGNGNLILNHQPTSINVIRHFNGQLIHGY